MEQAVIGFVGVIVGTIISYFLNYKNNRKNAIHNILLERYQQFIKLKEELDYDLIDLEIYQIKDLTHFNITDKENKKFLYIEMNKTLDIVQKTYGDISKIKTYLLNNQYILQHNSINVDSIITLTGYQHKEIIYNEIMNYQYNIAQFNLDLLLKNEQKYLNFIDNFSKLVSELKIKIERLLFKEKIC